MALKKHENLIMQAREFTKEIRKEGKYPATATRLLVQFQTGTVYKYNTNAAGLAKFTSIDFDEVVMVQVAVGELVQSVGGKKFQANVIAMLDYKEFFFRPKPKEEEEENEEAGF